MYQHQMNATDPFLSATRHVCDYRARAVLLAMLAVATVALNGAPATAQMNPFPSHDVKVQIDSGFHFNYGDKPEVVWSQVIEIEEAEWVRLRFRHIVLAERGGTSSTLRIVSHEDGAEQILNAKSARQWRNTSAYFNGNTVTIELIAWPNGRMNSVVLDTVTAGELPNDRTTTSICDTIDDRVLSNDDRVARTVPGGCTAWLFNDRLHCMITAGHCASSTDVVEFNVPLSNSDGSYNHPGPEDQYIVDQDSMQSADGGIGHDWAYFGCFENSTTGLTPFEAQGDSFELVLPEPVGGGDMIRITGHGTTSFPVDPTWNGAQKTHVGPYVSFNGSALGYRTDTTGGNSGSPVIFEDDGTAIGVHAQGGCGSGGSGNNWGTGSNNAGWQNALNNPQGICDAFVVEIGFTLFSTTSAQLVFPDPIGIQEFEGFPEAPVFPKMTFDFEQVAPPLPPAFPDPPLVRETGITDTIVIRRERAIGSKGTTASIPIEMVALSLISANEINLFGVNEFFLATIADSKGSFMEITFDDENGGTFDSTLELDIRLTGQTSGIEMIVQKTLIASDVAWGREPELDSIKLDGINWKLDGTKDHDFWPEVVVTHDDGKGTSHGAGTTGGSGFDYDDGRITGPDDIGFGLKGAFGR